MIRRKILANGEAAKLNRIFIRIIQLPSVLKVLQTVHVCFKESNIVEQPLDYNNSFSLGSAFI